MHVLELSLQELNTFEDSDIRLTRVRELAMLTLARPCDLDLESVTPKMTPAP